mgnify:CR=1 FL=1
MTTLIQAIAQAVNRGVNFRDIENLFFKNNFTKVDSEDKYVIQFPYDRDCEKMTYRIQGQNVDISVETLEEFETISTDSMFFRQTRHNEYNVMLPKSVDVATVSQQYDSKTKTMTLNFEKVND